MSQSLDKRTHAYRDDLADASLAQQVHAARYVEGTKTQLAVSRAPLYSQPDSNTSATSMLLYGETFTVFEEKDGWAWGQCDHDNYVGYLPLDHLRRDVLPAEHHVSVLSTYLFREPDPKSPPVQQLHLMSPLFVSHNLSENGFVQVDNLGWIYAEHLSLDFGTDHTAEALKFLYTPYLWGGRSNAGLDCSGLVQIALAATGHPVPRDSDQQEAALGTPLDNDDIPQKGDLAFFPGHVGIMLDDMHLLHANATHMRVSIDPLKDVIQWIKRDGGQGLSSIKRLSPMDLY